MYSSPATPEGCTAKCGSKTYKRAPGTGFPIGIRKRSLSLSGSNT
ncbi:hypothetical protein BSMD_034180 [Bacillus subtilis Miyagi-4]|nr:hypothetical protein BSMD_034180 [Bacillus subtilis Miyagi-4]